MAGQRWHGIYAILVTPFREDFTLDVHGLESQVDYCVSCGVHGMVAPVLASEFHTLTDDERVQIYQIVARMADGRVPFVAGVSGVSAPHAVSLAKAAYSAGATALIAMPPYVGDVTLEDVLRYFEAITLATPLPVVVQNAPGPMGRPLSTNELVSLLQRISRIEAVKEEVPPSPHRIRDLVKALSKGVTGVFGGLGGIHFLRELARGAAGTMPACQFADVMVDIYEWYVNGNQDRAQQLFDSLLPAMVMECLYGVAFSKECLRRRGVIQGVTTRRSTPRLDQFDKEELDRIWGKVTSAFRWP